MWKRLGLDFWGLEILKVEGCDKSWWLYSIYAPCMVYLPTSLGDVLGSMLGFIFQHHDSHMRMESLASISL